MTEPTIRHTSLRSMIAGDPAETPVVIGYETLQFHRGGLFDGEPTENIIHLVRRTRTGTPGPTLCGRARFDHASGPFDGFIRAKYDGSGWSVGGGIQPVGVEFSACPDCLTARDVDLPVSGHSFGRLFR